MNNYEVWEARYSSNFRIATWPFDQVVSMVMRRFASATKRSEIKILDYGCGGGNNLWFLAKEGFDSFACDIAPSAVAMTRNRLVQEGFDLSDEHFCVLDGERLPYQDRFFSAIIDRQSLCQSPWSDVKSRVQEFRRVLAPGGWYLGMNFSCHHPDTRYGETLGNGDWHNFRQGIFMNQGRRHLFSVNDIVELFAEWEIDCLAENKITSILGRGDLIDSSEYLIAAQSPSCAGNL